MACSESSFDSARQLLPLSGRPSAFPAGVQSAYKLQAKFTAVGGKRAGGWLQRSNLSVLRRLTGRRSRTAAVDEPGELQTAPADRHPRSAGAAKPTPEPAQLLLVGVLSRGAMFDQCVFLQDLLSKQMLMGKALLAPDPHSKVS